MVKEYKWNLKDGREVTLKAECTQELIDRVVDADGQKVNLGKTEINTRASLVAYVDGKFFDKCWDTAFWTTIDTKQVGVKKIWGIKGIGFTEERAAEIETFLNEVIEDGKTEEVRVFEAEKIERKKADRIKAIKERLEEAEHSGIYTKEEAETRRQSYINVVNEGGAGFVPHFYCYEEVDALKKELEELNA